MGVASLMFVPLETLVPVGEIGLSPIIVRAAFLIQPAVLVVIAILVGRWLAPKVGLDAPVLRAASAGEPFGPILIGQLPPAAIVAFGMAILLLFYGQITEPYFAASGSEFYAKIKALDQPLITKILYGGVVEELLMRWAFMTFVVWLVWRLAGAKFHPSQVMIWTGIVVAAIVFAVGHLPLLYAIAGQPPPWLIISVIIGNALPGLAMGWLFSLYGLEAAMAAHAFGHVFASIGAAVLPFN